VVNQPEISRQAASQPAINRRALNQQEISRRLLQALLVNPIRQRISPPPAIQIQLRNNRRLRRRTRSNFGVEPAVDYDNVILATQVPLTGRALC
jgi:hypothetical protein